MNKFCPPSSSDDLSLLFCINPSSMWLSKARNLTPCFVLHIEQESDRREGKGRRCWLGGRILECRNSHLAARMIGINFFERISILGGRWFGVNQMIIHFPKHPYRQVSVLLFILFFKSSWCFKASAAWHWINSISRITSNDLCLPFCLILILMARVNQGIRIFALCYISPDGVLGWIFVEAWRQAT